MRFLIAILFRGLLLLGVSDFIYGNNILVWFVESVVSVDEPPSRSVATAFKHKGHKGKKKEKLIS